MMGYDRRVDGRGLSYIVGIRKYWVVRVPRRINIVQDWHNDFPFDHRGSRLGVGTGTPLRVNPLTGLD